MTDLRTVNELATALVSMAAEKRVLPEILIQLRELEEAFASNPAFIGDLSLPGIPIEKRFDTLRNSLGKDIHPFLTNALLLLLERNLLSELTAFTNAVRKTAQTKGAQEVTVASAIELTETEKNKLTELLTKKLNADITLREIHDPSLLGGLVITMGDWRFDGSVKGRIDRLTQELYV